MFLPRVGSSPLGRSRPPPRYRRSDECLSSCVTPGGPGDTSSRDETSRDLRGSVLVAQEPHGANCYLSNFIEEEIGCSELVRLLQDHTVAAESELVPGFLDS